VDRSGQKIESNSTDLSELYPIAVLRRLEEASAPVVTFASEGSTIATHFPIDALPGSWLSLDFTADDIVHSADESVDISLQPIDSLTNPLVAVPELASGIASGDTTMTFIGQPVLLTATMRAGTAAMPSWLPVYTWLAGSLAAAFAVLLLATVSVSAFRQRQIATDRSNRLAARLEEQEWAGFEQTIVGMAELNVTGAIVAVNDAFAALTGYAREQLIGAPMSALVVEEQRVQHENAFRALLEGNEMSTKNELQYERSDGQRLWVSEHLGRALHATEVRILAQCQDITDRRQATWELARQALHDELTGLPNRAMLLHRLRAALADSEAKGGLVGVMFIDVDRFKIVNDSLGHKAGDQLIKHIAHQLGTAVRVEDTVSRFGGDEFVVLCAELMSVGEAVAVADRIRRSLIEPFQVAGNKLYTTLSIGLAVSRDGEYTADELLRDADAAMYRAKDLGRNRIEIFDEGMREKLVERMELEQELRAAIRDQSLSLHFQSIVDCPSGYPVGFESLVRWHHPTRGLLSPGQFLPTAEEAGLTSRIDGICLRKACQQLADWTKKYPAASNLYVSSNIVPTQFPRFIEQIEDTLKRSGLAPNQLLIEVVENALLDDAEGSLHAITSLRDMGVQIAIDDFGTGFSSLSYLTQFRPDKLKIDRSFVMKLPEDRATGAVVRAIADMARALDIDVIAEGVETMEQADALRSMGVPYIQGFLFAKPRPPEEIEAWLQSTHGLHYPQSGTVPGHPGVTSQSVGPNGAPPPPPPPSPLNAHPL